MKQIVVVLFLAATAGRAEMLRLEASVDAMGSTFSVILYDESRSRMEAAAEEAFAEVRRLDLMLSNYRAGSELSEVNRNAATRPVKVTPELFSLLQTCLGFSRASGGAFDITVGPLMKVWGFYKGSGRLPHRAEIRGVLTRIGYKNILLDEENRTVSFARQGVELDPGGIGKGYAVDKLAEKLRETDIKTALVTASGSSIFGMGSPPGEKGWKVNIRDPKRASQHVETIYLHDESMSTSGNYEKFFRAEGKLYSHIMDPRTGYPAPGMLSVSVIAAKTLDSEAWTKPMFINGRLWAAQQKLEGMRVFFCEDKVNQPCGWLQ